MKALAARKMVEKALAFAHAAVDETTPHRVVEAQAYAAKVLPCLAELQPVGFTLGEARHFVELVGQLRAILSVLEKKLAVERANSAN